MGAQGFLCQYEPTFAVQKVMSALLPKAEIGEHRTTIHPSAPLQNNARIADALIAVEQIHLLG